MKTLKCCGCKDRFDATTMLKINNSNFHNYQCAIEYAQAKAAKTRAKQLAKKLKQEKTDHNAAKRKFKANDKGIQTTKTQTIFNKYIRLRDSKDPCISCGRYRTGKYDAGHFKTIGGHSELRFHEDNCHKQCHWNCNIKKSGNIMEYRKRLVKKIGVDRVEWLEGPHKEKKYTLENLKTLQRWFKRKTKRLEAKGG